MRRKENLVFMVAATCIFAVLAYIAHEGRREVELAKLFATPLTFRTVTLYEVDAFENQETALEQLCSLAHTEFDEETTRGLFRHFKCHRSDCRRPKTWLGIADLKRGGQARLAITPDGFFRVFGLRGFYEITGESKILLTQKLGEIPVTTFGGQPDK